MILLYFIMQCFNKTWCSIHISCEKHNTYVWGLLQYNGYFFRYMDSHYKDHCHHMNSYTSLKVYSFWNANPTSTGCNIWTNIYFADPFSVLFKCIAITGPTNLLSHPTIIYVRRWFLAATKQLYEWFSPSVRLSVRLSVCHTFLTMFPSSYHHEIFRSYYQWQKWRPCKRSRSGVKGQGHRGHDLT